MNDKDSIKIIYISRCLLPTYEPRVGGQINYLRTMGSEFVV